MIPFNSPPVPVVPGADEESDSPWQQEVQRWRDVEIRRLEALLSSDSVVSGGAPGGGGWGNGGAGARDTIGPLIHVLLDAPDTGESMRRLFTALVGSERLVEAFAEVEGASTFGSVLELARQRKGAKALHAVINNPMSTEKDLRAVLTAECWVFGGHYIPPVRRENIPVLDQVDLALIGLDTAIHIVIVGPANVPELVVEAVDGYRVGPDVQDLVTRAVNQLLNVDKQEAVIQATLGVETRRAFATVVVGHPAYAAKLPGTHLRDTLRTYGSYLSGIEVMTYQQLMDSAERSLDLIEQTELAAART
jgi:hypothetical protein